MKPEWIAVPNGAAYNIVGPPDVKLLIARFDPTTKEDFELMVSAIVRLLNNLGVVGVEPQ